MKQSSSVALDLGQIRSTAPLSAGEARSLTDRIRTTAEDLAALLQEAYDRRAWAALGYASWRAYAVAELDLSQSRAYQLLDLARVVAAIQEAAGAPISTMVEINERTARELKPVLSEVQEEIRERVDAGEAPADAVEAVITEHRAERGALAVEADDDETEKSAAPDAGGFDLTTELEHLQDQVRRLETEVDALSASDLGAEVRTWTEKYARLEGRLQQELATSREAQRQAKYYGDLLKKIRTTLGVPQTQGILPRLVELLQEVAH